MEADYSPFEKEEMLSFCSPISTRNPNIISESTLIYEGKAHSKNRSWYVNEY